MLTLLIAVGSLIGYVVAYHTYGRWLSRKIFKLDAGADVPSRQLRDDRDFVPTRREILFGHHFTSIAGTGPIVGPALAVIWGWLPALLWVLFGCIFIGAVHDLGSIVVSIRNRAQTIGEVAGRLINPRVKILFLLILMLALGIVLAIFGLVIAILFDLYPASVPSVWMAMPVAVVVGWLVYRKNVSPQIPALLSVAVLIGMIAAAVQWPVLATRVPAIQAGSFRIDPVVIWTVALLVYCYIASVLPVWVLLQPRDYINSYLLILGLLLLLAGIGATALFTEGGAPMVAPVYRATPPGAPPIVPLLFVTIACGAVSGFHCLVASGTTSKQLARETDAHFVGYGSMLTEGFLAVMVILACCAGLGLGVRVATGADTTTLLTGQAAWDHQYESWKAAGGLRVVVPAFVIGAANFIESLGIPRNLGIAFMAVLVCNFAATTLDTATRLQRYVVQELANDFRIRPLQGRHGATMFAVGTAALIAFIPPPGTTWATGMGKGGLTLWPVFGAANQLLAGLAFLVVAFYLHRRGIRNWFIVLPMIMMLVVPLIATLVQTFGFGEFAGWLTEKQYHLVAVGLLICGLQVWMVIEALLLWPKVRGILEAELPPLPSRAPAAAATASAAGGTHH